jgi:predicted aldo/keto reductase-like oxidoreductase
MRYTTFGQLDWNASALGFGCMRLPIRGKHEDIDEAAAIGMIRRAIDAGVNYFDTAWGYHGGNSEIVLGKALRDGYRSRVKMATKLPPWEVRTAADFDRLLNTQLGRLQVDHVDLYLLHSLGRKNWDTIHALGVLEWAEKAMADGRVGHMGFSFHDTLPVFKEIVDAFDRWTFCQIQYNYMDETTQAGTEGLRYAADRGLAVVVMEPLLGGNLASPPAAIQSMWDGSRHKRSAVDWALHWLWDKPEVTVVLSGMSTAQQLEQNLESVDSGGPGLLSSEERDLVGHVAETYRALRPIPCTRCNYCLPCPSGVSIPHNLGLYNTAVVYNQHQKMRQEYRGTKEAERASACTACRECEEKCPQKIVVSEWMSCIAKELGP